MTLLDDWLTVFDRYAYNSRAYGTLAFHGLMGQVLKWQRIGKGSSWIDPRVSFFLMQDSGSGKSVGLEPVRIVADKLGMKMVSVTAVTDAAIIGTVEKVEYKEGRKTRTEWRHVPGILSYADIVHWDEGSILMRPDQHSMNMKNILQQALNPIGSQGNCIVKKLAHGEPLEVRPTCSLFITTYFPEEFEETLLNSGLLQRVLLYPRAITHDERLDALLTDVDKLTTQHDDTNERLMSIGRRMASLQKEYSTPHEWDYSEATPVLRNYTTKLSRTIDTAPPMTQRLLDTFVPRYANELYKIALHSAAIDHRDTIRTDDVKYALGIVQPLLRATFMVVENETTAGWVAVKQERGTERSVRYALRMCAPEGEWISKTVAANAIMKHMGKSRTAAWSALNAVIRSRSESVEEREEKGAKQVRWFSPSQESLRLALLEGRESRIGESTNSPSTES